MAEAPNDTSEPTAAQLAAWAGDQGTTLDEMRARVARNSAAVTATAVRMACLVEEARTRAAPDQARPGVSGRLTGAVLHDEVKQRKLDDTWPELPLEACIGSLRLMRRR